MMPGMIMLWYGEIVDIPSGWAHCDGNNGTPNLIAKFVVGADVGPFAPGVTGGASSHTHDFTGDGHWHTLEIAPRLQQPGQRGYATDTIPAVGTTDSVNHMPPYHALCYIMKLPIV